MSDDGSAWLENVFGANSGDNQEDMRDARCPKCNASDFVKIADAYADSRARMEEGIASPEAASNGGMTDAQIVKKFAPPRQSSAVGAALMVGVPLAAIAFYVYRRFGETPGQFAGIGVVVVTVMVLMTMARKFSDRYYYARRRWNRVYMCRNCGQVVAS